MYIDRIVYPKLGIIDEIEVEEEDEEEDEELENETTAERPSNKEKE